LVLGATSATFSIIYGVLLKPLPYQDPDRLVRVWEYNPVERFQTFSLSPADFLDYRKQNRVFQDIATYVLQDQQYGGDHPERIIGARVSHGFFACSALNRCSVVTSRGKRNPLAAQQTT
jgi:putative ABC transport system permease protein